MEDPKVFCCPISGELMQDPVIDSEGNTFDRKYIKRWLLIKGTSPITRTPMTIDCLKPNRSLRDAIQEYIMKKEGNVVFKKKRAKVAPKSANVEKNKDVFKLEPQVFVDSSVEKEGIVMFRIKPPNGKERTPSDICCVVDVSGSMGVEAEVAGSNGKKENYGLTVLCIVKHALKTIVNGLDDSDRFCLVVYSTSARVEMDLTQMTSENKAKALDKIENLRPESTTNIWDGLVKGLTCLEKGYLPGRKSDLFLLTDGEPNVSPPRGEKAMLQKYQDEHKDMIFSVNTFCFGYRLNSELLKGIAAVGGGSYNFIPDGSMVGTIFVNALANTLSSCAQNVVLSIEVEKGTNIRSSLHVQQDWGCQIQVGSVQFGQTRDFVFSFKAEDKPQFTIALSYEPLNCEPSGDGKVKVIKEFKDIESSQEVWKQHMRIKLIELINDGMIDQIKIKENIKKLKTEFKMSPEFKSAYGQGLNNDLVGQITEGFTVSEYFARWGRHFLPSLGMAHLLQRCNNFKDPGVQMYGGDIFNKLQDKLDKIFLTLPPPKPPAQLSYDNYGYGSYGYGGSAPAVSALSNMNSFHSSDNPCFHGDCKVTLSGGKTKLVKKLVKDDVVVTMDYKTGKLLCSKVRCILKTECKSDEMELVKVNDLLITPNHPVVFENKWVFPRDLGKAEVVPCPFIYSFILESDHICFVNDIPVICLGHGFKEGILKHPYYGTNAIIKDLMKKKGWSDGLILMKPDPMVVKDGVVVSIK